MGTLWGLVSYQPGRLLLRLPLRRRNLLAMDSSASFSSPFTAHKHLKEQFVSNLHGTTMLEIAALSAVVPAFVILRQWGSSLFSSSGEKDESSSIMRKELARTGPDFWRRLSWDFVVVIVPTVASLTVLSDWVYTIMIVVSGLLLTMVLSAQRSHRGFLETTSARKESDSTRKAYLSSYRFVMMLVTCVTILAVDFTVFPRRFAKTETYGTGLMDIGVGSFVVANALVSRQARNLPPSKYGGILRNTSPLLVLGFARLILTKGVDYQEHVAEYGVHWNFFFTLAGVALLTSLIHIPPSWCGTLGILLLTVYQTVLSSGLNTYLLSSERGPGLLSLNKEGIASTLGYWGLYLISIQLGHHLTFKHASIVNYLWPSSKHAENRPGPLLLRWGSAVDIWTLDLILWPCNLLVPAMARGLAVYMDYFVEKISRRTCNLAYVLFVLAQNFEVMGIFVVADLLVPLKQFQVLDIFDHNLLPTFLLANVLTGVVNMSTPTIFVAPPKAFLALLLYTAVLIGSMAVAEVKQLRLKFW